MKNHKIIDGKLLQTNKKFLGLLSIGKIKEYLEFTYYSKKDSYSIVYAIKKNQPRGYTEIQHVKGNWYYCYISYD